MNPNDILDAILRFIYINDEMQLGMDARTFTFSNFFEPFIEHVKQNFIAFEKNSFPLTKGEYSECLQKLANDNYLKTEPVVAFGGNITYTLYYFTFEGRWFINQGGYVTQKKRQDAEQIKNDAIIEQTKNNAEDLNFLTLILALGTTVAAFYYYLEIQKNIKNYPPLFTPLFLLLVIVFAALIVLTCILLLKRVSKWFEKYQRFKSKNKKEPH